MKKLFQTKIVLLTVALLLSPMPGLAMEMGTVSGENTSAAIGHEVEFQVSIEGNPGLSSFDISLRYDTSVFTLKTDDDVSLIECAQGEVTQRGMLTCGAAADGCRIFWSDTADARCDGVLFSVSFLVAQDALPGVYPIEVSYSERNTVNSGEASVPLRCENGSITIRHFDPMIYGAHAEAKQGATVDYTISLQDNPGIASFDVRVLFDPNVLTLSSEDNNCLLIPDNPFAAGNYVHRNYSNAVEVFWSDARNITASGPIFSLRFHVNESAPLDEIPIRVVCTAANTLDEMEQPVNLRCESGSINVLTNISVEFKAIDSNNIQITIANAPTDRQVIALYDSSHRLVQMSVVSSNAQDITMQLHSDSGRKGTSCKVFFVDSEWRPFGAYYEWME